MSRRVAPVRACSSICTCTCRPAGQYVAKFFAIVLTIFLTASLLGGALFHYADRLFSEFPALVAK